MLSKSSIDIPYICEEGFSASTEWLAIPVYVSVNSKEFHNASQTAQKIITGTSDTLQALKLNTFPINLLEFENEFEALKPAMELIKVNEKESQARVYNYIIIKYPEKGRFWEKVEHLSMVLDELYRYAAKFKSDKAVTIELGERYNFSK